MTTQRILAVLLLFTLWLAACSGATPSTSEPAEPASTAIPTQASEPTAAATSAPAPTEPPPPASPSPTPAEAEQPLGTEPSGYEVNVYTGNGFSIVYPPGAEIRSTMVENSIAIVGPMLAVRAPDVDWLYEGPGYTLTVTPFPNPEGVDVETWTRNFLLQSWQEAKASGLTPPEIYPVTEDGRLIEENLHSTVVRGQPAMFVENAAFGILDLAFYVACPNQVVQLQFQFSDEPAAGTNPLFSIQEALYTFLKEGFWCHDGDAPSLLTTLSQNSAQSEMGYTLRVYSGENGLFGIAYPATAQVVPSKDGSGVTILGPDVAVRPADADWTYTGPAYALDMATFEMDNTSAGYVAETWAREYLLRLWEEEKQQGGPTGSLPVSEDGVIDESRVGVMLLDNEPAFWVQYFQFDAMYRAFYVRCGNSIVQLGFREEIPANQPLADLQRDLYSLMLNTFECVPNLASSAIPAGEESAAPAPQTLVVNANAANSGSLLLAPASPNSSASYLVGDDALDGTWITLLDFGMADIQSPTIHSAHLEVACAVLNGDPFTHLGGIDVYSSAYNIFDPNTLSDPANIPVLERLGTITDCTPTSLDITDSLQRFFANAAGGQPYQIVLSPTSSTNSNGAEDMVEFTTVELVLEATP